MVKQPKHLGRESGTSKATDYKFRTASEVAKALNSTDYGSLRDSLTTLRNQLTVKHDEDAISPTDSRLLLARSWAEHSPGLPELFAILSIQQQGPQLLQPLVLNVVAHMLTLLSKHADAHGAASPILKTIYTPAIQGRLTGYLNGGQNEIIIGALKLFHSITRFPSGGDKKQAMENFPWGLKALPKLFFMRRKGKESLTANDMLARPDIRTLYMQFILAFVSQGCPTSVKTAFLEQHRDIFLSMFKGLHQDPYVVARLVLETCWEGLWGDSKLSRTLKLACFHEGTIQQIMKLYERSDPELEDDSQSAPADLAHHFLLAVTTKPGFGICFKDRGWYPRSEASNEADAVDKHETKGKASKIYNKILANVVKTLKVNEDPRQQELALRIFGACPELVAGYWSSAGLTLEPRLSLKWMTNVNFLASVVSLPIPSDSFILKTQTLPSTSTALSSSSTQYEPNPPPVQALLENTLPSILTKSFLTKGLQNASPLVQHTTASVICRSLAKFESLVHLTREISASQEENDQHGLWATCLRQYQRDIAKRLPDYRVVVAFTQQSTTTTAAPVVQGGTDGKAPQFTRTNETADMLNEMALRLLWLYFSNFPDLVAEVRFDSGKLFEKFTDFDHADKQMIDDAMDTDDIDAGATTGGFWQLRLLHVLRLLEADPQFSWSTSSGSGKDRTHLYPILMTRSQLPSPALKSAASKLITKLLGSSVLFEHDPDELSIWIDSIPECIAPDGPGSPQAEEAKHVISFLDEVVQTCLKNPYRYVEDILRISRSANSVHDGSGNPEEVPINYRSLPSPLLIAFIEEVRARVAKCEQSGSDHSFLPPVLTYTRCLILFLAGKQPDLNITKWLCKELANIIPQNGSVIPQDIRGACEKELLLLQYSLRQLEHPEVKNPTVQPSASRKVIEAFKRRLESGDSKDVLYEMRDLIRSNRLQESTNLVGMLCSGLDGTLSSHLVPLLVEFDPRFQSAWDLVAAFPLALSSPLFEWSLLQSDKTRLEDSTTLDTLTQCFFSEPLDGPTMIRRFNFLLHRFRARSHDPSDVVAYLTLVGQLIRNSPPSLSKALKDLVFTEDSFIPQFCGPSSESTLFEGVSFLAFSLDPASEHDKNLVAEILALWMPKILEFGLPTSKHQLKDFRHWLLFATVTDMATIWESIAKTFPNLNLNFVETLLEIMERVSAPESIRLLQPYALILGQLANHPWNSRNAERHVGGLLDAAMPIALDATIATERLSTVLAIPSPQVSLDVQILPLEAWLTIESWSKRRDHVVSRLLYMFASARPTYWRWITESRPYKSLGLRMTISLTAYFDTLDQDESPLLDEEVTIAGDILQSILREFRSESEGDDAASFLLTNMIAALASPTAKVDTSKLSKSILKADLALCAHLVKAFAATERTKRARYKSLLEDLVDRSLALITEALQKDDTTQHLLISTPLCTLIRESKTASPQAADSFLMATTQVPSLDRELVNLSMCLVDSVSLKPSVVNKVLQLTANHPNFRTAFSSPIRDNLAAYLSALFHKHPTNTCQPSHLAPLIQVFRGTASVADRKIMSIFSLFEKERKLSVVFLLKEWQPEAAIPTDSPTVFSVLGSLNPAIVFQSCLHLSNRRTIDNAADEGSSVEDGESRSYDCILILLLLTSAMSEPAPTKHVVWLELFRSNVFSVALRALSLKDSTLRKLGYLILSNTWHNLKNVEFQEKPHVAYLLDMVKDLRASPNEFKRLPTHTSLLLAYAFRGIFYPSHFLYPHTARHLLERPELDCNNIPMMLNMMYSSTDDWKKERMWMLRFIRDGFKSLQDWKLMRRRHVLELLTSQFEAGEDLQFRALVLEIIHKAVQIPTAITTLVARNSWLTWMEMQIVKANPTEVAAWASILEDMGKYAEIELLDKLTDRNWRSEMHRCLRTLFGLKLTFGTLLSLCRAFQDITLGEEDSVICATLSRAMDALVQIEPGLDPPQDSLDLSADTEGNRQKWASIIEVLWRISMTLDHRAAEWYALTSRMVIWRGYSGESRSTFEWVRKQMVLMTGSS